MVANTDEVYVASRARLDVTPDESASDDAPWLSIVVGEMRPKLAHDVAELVKWAEFEDRAGYACETGRQAVRAYTMPLSRSAPSKLAVTSVSSCSAPSDRRCTSSASA